MSMTALDPNTIDLPARPQALVELSLLLAQDEINLQQAAQVVQTDMALSSAVLRTVNSPRYGLSVRVQSVQQALTYLGMREVAALTFEMGLRSAFPHQPEILQLWDRAARRGLIMGQLGQWMGVEPWAAHSAGLFEECGKAVLFCHSPEHYRSMMRAASNDAELCQLEQVGFGIGHDALGAVLCESWGLAPAAVACVRLHVQAQSEAPWPAHLPHTAMLAVSVLARAIMEQPDSLEEVVARVAGSARLDPALMLRSAQRALQAQREDPARP
jgi:HD-like signal output (HDOD) protein